VSDDSRKDAAEARVALQPAERRAVGLLTGTSMLRMLGLFSLLPVLSVYAAGLDGATPMLVGLAVGGYGLTQAALQIPLGALSDRLGRRPVILFGLAVFAVGSAVAAFSDTITGVIAGRFLQGAGAISATLTALLADATRPAIRTRSMAVLGIGIGASFIVAMVFGPWFSARFGVPALFLFGVAAAIAGAALVLLVPAVPLESRGRPLTDIRPALRPDLLRLDAYVFLLHAIMTASFVALPFVLGGRLELPTSSHWMIYVGSIVLSLVLTVPLILRDERRGKAATMRIAVVLLLVGQAVLAFASFSTVTVFIALVLFFGGFNFLEAGLPARLSLLADDEARGASLGVYSTAQFLGAFAGGLIGGRFLGDGSPANVFFVCALLAAIWLALAGTGRAGRAPDPT